MLLGSHLSIAGGLHHALESAKRYGFQAVALFVRSPRQWACPPLSQASIVRFRETRKQTQTKVIVAHASYLINLAGGGESRRKGITAVREDLTRCAALGIEYLVLHPGSCKNLGEGIKRIVEGLDEAISAVPKKKVKLLVETMAGQGHGIGQRFEHLAEILEKVERPTRFGVCFDTCHIFAAGYDIRSPESWEKTMAEFESVIGLKRLYAIHCNDSLKPLGSRVDRHAHIGEGHIGQAGFINLLRDPRVKNLPLILETPKGKRASDGKDWDEINAQVLDGCSRSSL